MSPPTRSVSLLSVIARPLRGAPAPPLRGRRDANAPHAFVPPSEPRRPVPITQRGSRGGRCRDGPTERTTHATVGRLAERRAADRRDTAVRVVDAIGHDVERLD